MASNPTDIQSSITLTPPDPVPAVAPAQAAGLVPVAEEARSKLEAKAEAFVNGEIGHWGTLIKAADIKAE